MRERGRVKASEKAHKRTKESKMVRGRDRAHKEHTEDTSPGSRRVEGSGAERAGETGRGRGRERDEGRKGQVAGGAYRLGDNGPGRNRRRWGQGRAATEGRE